METIRLHVGTVDVGRQRLLRGDQEVPITGRELALLVYLARRPGEVIGREELLREVWGYADSVVSRAVDAGVRRLRVKVERDPAQPDHIVSMHGEGYRFQPIETAPVLRAPSAGFVGRQVELTAVRSRLVGPGLVTLTGPGGVGKTRLAREIFAGWRGQATWVDLADHRSAAAARDAVALVLEVPDPAQIGSALDADPRQLVVLDNLEQVEAGFYATVGAWSRHALVLATSRHALEVDGESAIAVGPLASGEAVSLFVDRATGLGPGDREAVAVLVERLERLPLAIELAAARTPLLSPAELSGRLERGFALLRGGSGRHASLATAVAWSWDLLAPAERAALVQATVFRGGFSLAAAEAVIEVPGAETIDLVDGLLRHGLARAERRGPSTRLYLFEPVRELAAAMADPGEAVARHADFFASTPAGFDDLDNLLAVAAAARDGTWAVRAARAAATLLRDRNVGQAVRVLAAALARSDVAATERVAAGLLLGEIAFRASDLSRATRVLNTTLDLARGLGDVVSQAWACGYLGRVAVAAGRPDEARPLLQRAGEAFDALGDRAGRGVVVDGLALLEPMGSPEAIQLHQEALTLFREAGNRALEGSAASNLGRQFGWRDPSRERAYYALALEVARELGNRRSEALILGNLGVSFREEGAWDEGAAHLEASLATYREIGATRLVVVALAQAADLEECRANWQAAWVLYGQALELDRAEGDRRFEGTLLANLGGVEWALGRVGAARGRFRSALARHEAAAHRERAAWVRVRLAELELTHGDAQVALGHARAAMEADVQGAERIARAVAWATLADALAATGGDPTEALATALERLGPDDPAAPRLRLGYAQVVARQVALSPTPAASVRLARLRAGLFPGLVVRLGLVTRRLGLD